MDREIERKSARAGQLACAAIAAWLITPPLVVCASQERAAEVAPAIEMDSLAGRWNTAAGKTWEFQRRGVATYNARSVVPSTPQEYRATVREIGGAKFLEVSFLAPGNSAGVPVFLYTTVEVAGDTMTLRRVRAEWLEREVRGDGRLAFVSTGNIERGTGGLAVRSQRALVDLLERAVGNEEALAEAEVGRRVE